MEVDRRWRGYTQIAMNPVRWMRVIRVKLDLLAMRWFAGGSGATSDGRKVRNQNDDGLSLVNMQAIL
jgi:hypothetical protein